MFTISNYFTEVAKIDVSTLPDLLQESHRFVMQATKNGASWQRYETSAAIREAIDLHIQGMNNAIAASPSKAVRPKAVQASFPTTAEKKPASAKKKKGVTPSPEITSTGEGKVQLVARIPDELRFIRRFIGLDGKEQTKEQLLRFINSLQKAIVEKRIRKTSEWAEQIRMIQKKLIDTYNGMKGKITIELQSTTLEKLKSFADSEKLLASVAFIKRYIGMNEKIGIKEKAKTLLIAIDRAYDKRIINSSDPYGPEIAQIRKNLQSFIADKNQRTLEIETAELSGLQGILGCTCGKDSLNGPADLPQVMRSTDFVKLDFPTIGFRGKWQQFIGDPAPGFTAMVFGKPKFGKSTLCLDFAGYLAREHGSVLYVAKEEGLNSTLKDKVYSVHHPSLTVASELPNNLSAYQYIFLDSVTRLGLSPDALRKLKASYSGKSFIFVFQVTKGGAFRGNNDFQHDVDVIIEVAEWGKARQYGRFNQGGEMYIFTTDDNQLAA